MPNTSAAKKALRQNKTRKDRNALRKSAIKDAIKEYRGAIASENKEEAKKHLSTVYKALDKAAKKNTIKKGKADRIKSRLSKQLEK